MTRPVASDWIVQTTTTTGIGPITLGEAKDGYVTCNDSFITDQQMFYSLIAENGDRESGSGLYSKGTNTFTRSIVYSSITNGAVDSIPTAIDLNGTSTFACTLNAKFVNDLYAEFDVLIDAVGSGGGGGSSAPSGLVIDVTRAPYSIEGSGDETAGLQAAATAATALATGTAGNGQDARVLLYIPPGLKIYVSTNITIASHLVDVDMRGSQIVGGGLHVGSPGRGIFRGSFQGINIYRDYTPDPWLSASTVGFKLYNAVACDIDIYRVEGFRSLVQLRAEWGSGHVDGHYTSYNKVVARDLRNGKYHLHLLNVDAPGGIGSWCNANEFHLGNIQNGVHGCGTIAGVCIESSNDDDESRYASNNVFHDPVFQLNGASEPSWTSGAVVSSGNVGRCYQSGMYSYRLVTAGTNGTTALYTIARNPGDSVTSGTAVYECEGFMLRVPFLLKNAGTLITVYDPYSETGRGPFIHAIGPYVGGSHAVINGTLQQDNPYAGQTGNPEWFDELQCETPTGTEITSGQGYRYRPTFSRYINTLGELFENEGLQDTRIDTGDLSMSAIMGANGWASTELVWVTWTGSAPSYSGVALNNGTETDIRLGDEYLLATPDSWKTHMGLALDCTWYKLFKITCRSDSTYSAIGFLPIDSSGTLMTIGTGTSVEGNDIAVTRASIDYRYFYNTSGTHRETWVKVSENVDHLIIVPAYGAGTGGGADSTAFRWNGFTVEAYPNKYKRYGQFKFISPFFGNSTTRVSWGTPLAGYFPRAGEIIQNSLVSGGINEAIGWQVNTTGVLAIPWTTGTEVYFKELRAHGGRVYYAGADGTTGATAPTGTTSSSDGTITWYYKDDEAVLSPLYKGISADEQLLLDYDYTLHDCKWWLDVDTTPADGYLDEVDVGHGPVKSVEASGHESAVTVTDSVATKMQSRDLVWTTIDADWYSWLQYPISYTPGHTLFVVYELDNIVTHGAAHYFATRFDEMAGISQYLLDAYIPPAYPQDYANIPDGTTEFQIAYRIPTLASGGGVPFNWVQLNLVSLAGSLPKRTEFRVKRIQIISVDDASTALGIDITGYSAAQLYGLMNTSLTAVPPQEIKITDSTTGELHSLTIDSGALEIDGVPTGGSHTHALSDLTQSGATTGQVATWSGSAWAPVTPSGSGSVVWGSITGTLSSQTDLNSALSGKEASITAGTTGQYWRGDKSWQTLNGTAVGLSNVENTALSTWTGSANIVTVGTIGTGTWNATAIADGKIASALTGKTYNGLTLTANATGWSLAGGTTSKTLTLSNTLTLAGTDGSTLNVGAGGTLGSAAYTASTAYATAAHSHTASDLSDFNSASRAQTEAELVAGTNVTITPSGSGATRLLTIAASGGGGSSSFLSKTLSANTTLVVSDLGYHIKLSGSGADRTLTFDTPANLGNGWYCTVENTDPVANGYWWHILSVVDGISTSSINGYTESFSIHPREIREFYVESGALYSRILRPFAMRYQTSISFKMPSGYGMFGRDSLLVGGGGSGGKQSTYAGGGGGGGATPFSGILCPSAGTTVTVTVGAGGAGVTADGTNGNVGNNTTLAWSGGPTITGYAGGAGSQGVSGSAGGGGGGIQSAGGSASGTTAGSGGAPITSATYPSNEGFGGAYGATGTAVGYTSVYGGGGGGASGTASGKAGGNSVYGGPGGGGISGTGAGTGGTSYIGVGGDGNNTTSGGDGTFGGGGGGTRSGTRSGNGGDGYALIKAI